MFFVGELFRVLFYVLFIGCFSFLFDGGARASVGDVEGEELVFARQRLVCLCLRKCLLKKKWFRQM